MKVKKLGLDWGAAYEEAEPIRISHGDVEITVFVSESGDLIVEMPGSAAVTVFFDRRGEAGLEARICNMM